MKDDDTSTKKRLTFSMIDTVRTPEDLKPIASISVNWPPSDGRCMCCGRHLSELTPFGGPGDPVRGDFSGALLIKYCRPTGPYDEEAVKAHKEALECHEADGYDDHIEWMKAKYGEEEGFHLYITDVAWNTYTTSWECRDCVILPDSEYFARLYEGYREEQERQEAEEAPEESGPQ